MTRAKQSSGRADATAPASGPPGPRTSLWRRTWTRLGAGTLVGLAAVTVFWFQPQKLLFDQRIDEAVPGASAGSSSAGGSARSTAGAEPVELAAGVFTSLEHETVGTARVLRLADGRRILRFEGFATSNGPVLVVWLTTNPALGPEDAFDDDPVALGALKGNVGDQNYVVPADVDLDAYAGVVVWCDRFDVAFGAADLIPRPVEP